MYIVLFMLFFAMPVIAMEEIEKSIGAEREEAELEDVAYEVLINLQSQKWQSPSVKKVLQTGDKRGTKKQQRCLQEQSYPNHNFLRAQRRDEQKRQHYTTNPVAQAITVLGKDFPTQLPASMQHDTGMKRYNSFQIPEWCREDREVAFAELSRKKIREQLMMRSILGDIPLTELQACWMRQKFHNKQVAKKAKNTPKNKKSIKSNNRCTIP